MVYFPVAWKTCVVRLDIQGKPEGTGFFVGAGLILTCSHVVQGKPVTDIKAYWLHGKIALTISTVNPANQEVDLALLTVVETTAVDHPVVTLGENPQKWDLLETFGYPEKKPEGDPGTFECEGMMGGDNPLIKFKAGQVEPGCSGSPLVHQATQKVCGVIKTTRDRRLDLGGRAIPTSVVWQVFPQLKPQSIPENPFVPTSGAVNRAEQFFDRERELQTVFDILNGGSSVAVIGPRQVGKSSLLRAIGRQAETQLDLTRRPVYLNLQWVKDDQDFYGALCGEIGIEVCQGYPLTQAMKKLDPPVLLLLDEVEKMTWDGFTQGIRSQLRGLAAEGSGSPLRLVIGASMSLDRLFPDSEGNVSPLKGICLEEALGGWDARLVRQLITERLVESPISFCSEEVEQIITETGGHPQQVMVACFRLYNAYRDRLQSS